MDNPATSITTNRGPCYATRLHDAGLDREALMLTTSARRLADEHVLVIVPVLAGRGDTQAPDTCSTRHSSSVRLGARAQDQATTHVAVAVQAN